MLLVRNEWKENLSKNPIFDLGGTSTSTTVSGYAKLRVIKPIVSDISAIDLIKKLDSLKEEPASRYGSTSEARAHIKKLLSE